ncbi:chloride channel protein [Leuconostoc palmae]|uniref:chloride channel protein n=1 Tax=Leuconostoc palmae TaxID=501487 RepID=UPI001C7D9100|nr:chloride channel protein [Leuconostoc palmae]
MNKKWFWFLIVLGVIVFVVGPLFVQYNHWSLGYRGSGDWLGFWGSYLGVVPSGLIAYLVAKYQIDNNKTLEEKQKLENSLPYAQVHYHQESYFDVFTYVIEYRIASYDGRPLIFKVFLHTIMGDGTISRHEISDNKEEESLTLNFSALVRSYALEIIMFNGVKVFVTDNNNAQEVIHMYKKEDDDNWKVYGVRPSQNVLSESIENINKMITN